MKKRSLVLVTVDCLRADHVGFQGYSCPVTPNLDALAENSTVFTNAIVVGAPTYFSFPGILASRYPLALGRDVLGIAPREPTMATALHDAGYATAAFLAGNPYLSRRYGYNQGFDSFQDFLSLGSIGPLPLGITPGPFSRLNQLIQSGTHHDGLLAGAYEELYFWYCQWRTAQQDLPMDTLRRYPAANVVVDRAQSWLSGLGKQPFFLWLHLMDPHHPYYPPEESLAALGVPRIAARRARFLNSFWNRGDIGPQRLSRYKSEILSLYDAGVHWVDKQLSRLVEGLQNSQRWDETVFVVTADHGEAFLEHGDRYHSPTSLPEHLIHVPLLLHARELSGKRLSQRPFSLIHLAPTLLDAVGVSPPESFQGQSGWGEISAGELPGGPAITECVDGCNNPAQAHDRLRPRLMAVRDEELKLVVNFRENRDSLYDLRNDPEERVPLSPGQRSRERSNLLQIARQHLLRASESQKTDLRLRARLRELQQSERMAGREASLS